MAQQMSSPPGRRRWLGLGIVVGLVTGLHFLRRAWARRTLPPLFKTRQQAGIALITGASSGIGAAYAQALARAGYDLILVARRRERLESLAATLRAEHGILVEVLPADLSRTEDVTRVAARIAGLPTLDFLVNNAGFGRGEDFAASDITQQLAMVRLHVDATLQLTRAALPGMIARRRGAIVNVASVMAFYPLPGSATYAATKSALKAFTQGLHQELRGTGVRVQVLCPGLTRTEFHEAAKMSIEGTPSFAWLTAEKVVAHSLRDLAADAVVSVPGLGYAVLTWIAGLFPSVIFDGIGRAYTVLRGRGSGDARAGFSRRTYRHFRDAWADLREIVRRRAQLQRAFALLNPAFRERLMLAVTQVNRCRYCAQAHARMALESGLEQEEIEALLRGVIEGCPSEQALALLYAQHWAETGGKPMAEARTKLRACYGEDKAEAIEMVLRLIQTANLLGNSWDYLLYRLSGGRLGGE